MAEPILFQQPDVTSLDKSKKFAIGKAGEITENITISDYESQLADTFLIGTMQSNIGTLQSDLDTAEGDISTLEGQMSTANQNIGTLQSDLGTAQGDISTLEGQMSTAQQDIIDLESAVGTVDTWHVVGAVDEPTFNTDWTSTNNKIAFRKVNATTVHVTGEAYVSGSPTILVFRLPVGYRPTYGLEQLALEIGTMTNLKVTIDTDGYMNVNPARTFNCDFQFRII